MSEDDSYQKLDEDKLITDTSSHHTKKRKLKSEPWNSDVHEILGGKALIFRTKLSGKNYQFRLWLPAEKRYYTKSLRTKNLEVAIEKAESEYIRLISEVSAGYKIFSVTFKVLTEEYFKHQQQRVDSGMITQGRHTTIQSQIKHFLKFVGEKKKVDSVRAAKFKDYYKYRRKHNPEVLDVTLKNERSTISNLYKWGAENGYLNVNTNPTFDELKFSVPKKRNACLLEDYQKLYTYLQNWGKGMRMKCSGARLFGTSFWFLRILVSDLEKRVN